MFDYEILDRGTCIGRATVTREGLYWQIEAECRSGDVRLLRLYAHGAGEPLCLGVLMPEGDTLRLRRRMAVSSFPFGERTRITTQNQTEWQPFLDLLFGIQAEGAIRRGATVAYPCTEGPAFPWMGEFRRFRLGLIGEDVYWMTELQENPDEAEKMVDNGTKYDKISEV